MAKHARVLVSIWLDEEFTALPAPSQRLYLLLISQPKLSMAGTLEATPRRWASLASDTTVEEVLEALGPLTGRGYIAYDEETEEVWVKAYIRCNDVVSAKSNVVPAFDRAAGAIMSTRIRRAMLDELERVLGELPADGSRERFVRRLSGWLRDSVMGGPGPNQLRLLGNDEDPVMTLQDALVGAAQLIPTESARHNLEGAWRAPSEAPWQAPSEGAPRGVSPVTGYPSSSIHHPPPPPPSEPDGAGPVANGSGVGVLVRQAIAMLAEQQLDADVAGGMRSPSSRDAVLRKRRSHLTRDHAVELTELAKNESSRGPIELLAAWKKLAGCRVRIHAAEVHARNLALAENATLGEVLDSLRERYRGDGALAYAEAAAHEEFARRSS